MKCPKCGGNAELSNWGSYTDPDFADFHVECEKCGYHSMGSTDPQKAKEMFEKEMGMYYTNEQWLSRLSTKEKAEWLDKVAENCCQICDEENRELCRGNIAIGCKFENAKKWEMWLKQPHREVK